MKNEYLYPHSQVMFRTRRDLEEPRPTFQGHRCALISLHDVLASPMRTTEIFPTRLEDHTLSPVDIA